MATSTQSQSSKRLIPKYFIGVRTSAILEILLFLIPVTAFDVYFGNGDRFQSYILHPYSIIVLLVTVQYGTIEGIVATALSTLFLYAWNVPPQQMGETLFEYQFRLAVLPLIWFFASFILGELRMRLAHENQRLSTKLMNAEKQLETISREYEVLKETKENIESHLASQYHTITSTYKSLKDLETLKPAQVLLKLNNVVKGGFNVKKFSAYALGDNGLEIVTTEGWEPEDKYSLRIKQDHPLFWEIYGEHRIVCIINESDEKILSGEGLLAGPLINTDTEEVFGMLKVEDISFTDLNVAGIESFKTLCELIGMAYANARAYQQKEQNSLYYVHECHLFTQAFYSLQKSYLLNLAERNGFPLSKISVRTNSRLKVDDEKAIVAKLTSFLKKSLPKSSQLFHAGEKHDLLTILLPNDSYAETEKITHQLLNQIIKENEFGEMTFKFEPSTLYDSLTQEKNAKQ